MKQSIISPEGFMAVFGKFGFEIIDYKPDKSLIQAFVQGKDFGVYLTIQFGTFSIETFYCMMQTNIFFWQHFDTLTEIENLIIKNHVLSEQICENKGLAIFT